jgi:hypothetical protein
MGPRPFGVPQFSLNPQSGGISSARFPGRIDKLLAPATRFILLYRYNINIFSTLNVKKGKRKTGLAQEEANWLWTVTASFTMELVLELCWMIWNAGVEDPMSAALKILK